MKQEMTAEFELFDSKVRRLRNGNKLCLTFESPEDLETEKDLIEFRGCSVSVEISPITSREDNSEAVIIGEFEVFEIKCRRLRNGDKLQLVLEQEYKKEKEIEAVNMRFQDCLLFLKRIDQEIPGLDNSEEENTVKEISTDSL